MKTNEGHIKCTHKRKFEIKAKPVFNISKVLVLVVIENALIKFSARNSVSQLHFSPVQINYET